MCMVFKKNTHTCEKNAMKIMKGKQSMISLATHYQHIIILYSEKITGTETVFLRRYIHVTGKFDIFNHSKYLAQCFDDIISGILMSYAMQKQYI